MNRLEWKEVSKEYKIGYIIGCIIMFFVGLVLCLITFFYPFSAIPFIIGVVILRIILNNKRKKRENNEKNI